MTGPAVLLCALAPILTGCGIFGKDFSDVACPSTKIAPELSMVTRARSNSGNFADLLYRASLSEVKGSCAIDERGVSIEIALQTVAEIGPAATVRGADFSYFIVVTDDKNTVISKRILTNPITFGPNQNRAGALDTVEERIILTDPKSAPKYRIVAGFQLTEEELTRNRALGLGQK